MDSRLHADITARLDRDFQFKERGEWLRQGRCPSCDEKSVWTHAEAPWVLKCEKLNKCGAEWHVKELYPDLFDKWSERHPVTDINPHAAADAYLRDARGFDLERIKGWYTQEHYFDRELNLGSATVRFPVANAYWERIIDEPHRFGSKKAHFKKGIHYGHTWWVPPGLDLTAAKEVWIVEGIFDAIALLHHDVVAVSALTCNNDCAQSIEALGQACDDAGRDRPTLVWALDGDKAGRGYTCKYVKACREAGWDATAAQIPQQGRTKLDWNDMHQRGRLDAKALSTYRYYGALLVSESAGAKAVLMYQHGNGSSFPFEFDSRLFWFKLDLDKYHKASEAISDADPDLSKEEVRERALLEAHAVTEIATCYPQALYYQRQELTDESWYYFRVSFPHGPAPVKNTFTAAQIAGAAEFKKRLLAMASGAIYTGSTGMLDALMKKQLARLPVVETVDFIGYTKGDKTNPHRAYIFGDIAVQAGRWVALNDEDYFELGKLSIKSLNQSVGLHINTKLNQFRTDWVRDLYTAFGAKGVVALAFWFGALFAEQIREQDKSFPFLEIVGEAGAGKTTLIEFMWKLCGRLDYEGFDPSKSTLAARSRNFAQVSNLPVVLIESDRDSGADSKKGAFDWDELKTAYNGRASRARGMKNSGNETYEPPFRGAVVISQNAPVQASEAIMSRICHLYFDRNGQSPETRRAAETLERMPVEDVSGFILKAALAEARVMQLVRDLAPSMEKVLAGRSEIRSQRVIKNHGQLMALVSALADVFPAINAQMVDAAHDQCIAMAIERQESLNADHVFVQEFWEIFEYLEGETDPGHEDPFNLPSVLNHSRDPQLIAVSLPHFEQVCADRKLRHAPLAELKRVLATSRRHKFLGVRTVNSIINARFNDRAALADSEHRRPMSVKCWVFQA